MESMPKNVKPFPGSEEPATPETPAQIPDENAPVMPPEPVPVNNRDVVAHLLTVAAQLETYLQSVRMTIALLSTP